jgi:hypothetical protein
MPLDAIRIEAGASQASTELYCNSKHPFRRLVSSGAPWPRQPNLENIENNGEVYRASPAGAHRKSLGKTDAVGASQGAGSGTVGVAPSVAVRVRSERRRQSSMSGAGDSRRLRLELSRLARANSVAQRDLHDMSCALQDRDAEVRALQREIRVMRAQLSGDDGTLVGTVVSALGDVAEGKGKARRATMVAMAPSPYLSQRKNRYSIGSTNGWGGGRDGVVSPSRLSEGFGGGAGRLSLMASRASLDVGGRRAVGKEVGTAALSARRGVGDRRESGAAAAQADADDGVPNNNITARRKCNEWRGSGDTFVEFNRIGADAAAVEAFVATTTASSSTAHSPAMTAVPAIILERWPPPEGVSAGARASQTSENQSSEQSAVDGENPRENVPPVRVPLLHECCFPTGVAVRLVTPIEARRVAEQCVDS